MDKATDLGAPSAREPAGEHDELIARLADLYNDEYWAEINLHAAAQSLDEEEARRDVKRLISCAHEYNRACERIDDMKKGVGNDVLYGLEHGLVLGTALTIAQQIRDDRSKRAAREQQSVGASNG